MLFRSLQHALKFFDKLNPTTYNLLNRARGSDVETGCLQQVAVKRTVPAVTGGVRQRSGRAQVTLSCPDAPGPVPEPGTHSVCSSSGLGTHCSRCDSSWKALLCGSSMSRPYRALIRYGLLFTSNNCRRRSVGGRRAGGQDGSDGTAARPGGQPSGWAPRTSAPAPAVSEPSP